MQQCAYPPLRRFVNSNKLSLFLSVLAQHYVTQRRFVQLAQVNGFLNAPFGAQSVHVHHPVLPESVRSGLRLLVLGGIPVLNGVKIRGGWESDKPY